MEGCLLPTVPCQILPAQQQLQSRPRSMGPRRRLGVAPSLLYAFFTQNMLDVRGHGRNGIPSVGLKEGRHLE